MDEFGDLGKAAILPLGFAVGSILTSAPTGHELFRALLVWFALEYLAVEDHHVPEVQAAHQQEPNDDHDRDRCGS